MSYLSDQLSTLPPEKTWMKSRIEAIKNAPDGAHRWLRGLGKNSYEHAEADEEYIGKILQESRIDLCPEEYYLLLHSIYTHDIGYRGGAEEHPRRSYDMIIQNPATYFLYDQDLANAVASIGLAHGLENLAEIPDNFPVDFLSKTTEFDLRFLGALLLIGDEMDQGYLRVFNAGGQEQSPRNHVYHVEIGPQLAKIKTRPEDLKQWEQLRQIIDHIQIRLDSVTPILRQRGIKLEHVLLFPKVWAQQVPHKDKEIRLSRPQLEEKQKRILIILDRTTFGTDVYRSLLAHDASIDMIPVISELVSGTSVPHFTRFDAIVWLLGEDFSLPLSRNILDFVSEEVESGAGLIMFPFVAWSVSQGLNDRVERLLPVALEGRWYEGKKHRIDRLEKHPVTDGVRSFSIQNTYELLTVKENAECAIRDSDGNPFLVLGEVGPGRVAYLNVCSHLCLRSGSIISPWQQTGEIAKLFDNILSWVCRGHVRLDAGR